ncbi:MAG TPA: DUF2778 domain-containing protein [Bradyrhizobium sp.]|nr:DUF2778 domain-containing protein [Bradyrhizobium sp.]
MAFDTRTVDGLLSRRRMRWFETIAFALAAVVVALGAAAWITNFDQTALASAALPADIDRFSSFDRFSSSFEDRFSSASLFPSPARRPASQPLDRSALAALEAKLRATEGLFAPRLMSLNPGGGYLDNEARVSEAKAPAATIVPLPRSRPPAAVLEPRSVPAVAQTDSAPRREDRTLLQKLSDLRVTLASLTPDIGLFRRRPDLASLGYDGFTAVYDISAHAVYLPNGSSLEAHSGMGSLRDDPEHVSVPNAGATPPAIYELKPREQMFHGVQALRMIPVEGSDTAGRSGLLTHSFMLGPNGDSNGCVSIKDYDRFLKAFNDGEINRLVVVPSLKSGILALQRPTSPS